MKANKSMTENFKKIIGDLEEEIKELIEMDTDIKKAEEKIDYLGSDPKTLAQYKVRERSLHERANMISTAKEEGKIEVAKAALLEGASTQFVAKITGLDKEKIEELKKELAN